MRAERPSFVCEIPPEAGRVLSLSCYKATLRPTCLVLACEHGVWLVTSSGSCKKVAPSHAVVELMD